MIVNRTQQGRLIFCTCLGGMCCTVCTIATQLRVLGPLRSPTSLLSICHVIFRLGEFYPVSVKMPRPISSGLCSTHTTLFTPPFSSSVGCGCVEGVQSVKDRAR